MIAKQRILVIDDHPVVRQGIRLIIGLDEQFDVVGEADCAARGLAEAVRLRPDVVVLDLNLPDRSGFEVLHSLRRELPELPVLILSVQPEEHMAVRALKAGAAGFLSKAGAPEELVRALRVVAAGRRYISPAFAEWLALDTSGQRDGLPHERLSERELEVMLMLAQGQAVSDIAKALHRSPNTISTYRARILTKLGLGNNAALTEYALSHRLIR